MLQILARVFFRVLPLAILSGVVHLLFTVAPSAQRARTRADEVQLPAANALAPDLAKDSQPSDFQAPRPNSADLGDPPTLRPPLIALEYQMSLDEAEFLVWIAIERYSMYRRKECLTVTAAAEEEVLIFVEVGTHSGWDCGSNDDGPKLLDTYVIGRVSGSVGIYDADEEDYIDFTPSIGNSRRCRAWTECSSRLQGRGDKIVRKV